MSEAGPASAALPSSLVLVGAGKMGGAMLAGWLARGLDPQGLTVLDPHPSEPIRALAAEYGFAMRAEPTGVAAPEVLVLGIKPQGLAESAPALSPLVGPGTLLVSILAGKTVANLAGALPGLVATVRAMPNLPASIGRGATGLFASEGATDRQRRVAEALLSAVGIVEWVDREDLIDAVTALSGSGPAYLFHLAECLSAAGAAAGLPADLADRLARATIAGAAELMAQSGRDPARLREDVTSPGGTTAAALAVLAGTAGQDGGPSLAGLMRQAVAAAKTRAEELSG